MFLFIVWHKPLIMKTMDMMKMVIIMMVKM